MSVVNTCLLSLDSVPLSGQGAPVTYTLNVRVALAVQIPVYFSINEMECKEKKNVLGLIYQSQPHLVKKKNPNAQMAFNENIYRKEILEIAASGMD